MVDMATIQGAISSLQTAGNIAKSLFELKSMAEVQVKVMDLNSAILSAQQSALTAQSEQFTMIQRIRDLEEEIARVKAWEEQKQRYKLVHPWEGATMVVYALKESSKGTEAAHWICTKCYDDGRRTILQPSFDKEGWSLITCPTCKGTIHVGTRGTHKPTYAAD